MAGDEQGGGEKDWQKKAREFEKVKARAKALRLRLTCTICGEKAKLNCPCGTTQYCSTDCQRIDWRDRGHRKACKKIRDERAAEAARAEAPPPPPSTPEEVFYGPAPRSHADEVRARIAAEHEAARARREADPERAPVSARFGSRCPICLEDWDVNRFGTTLYCCCQRVCHSCADNIGQKPCPLCHMPAPKTRQEEIARLRRHVENDIPEAVNEMGLGYRRGINGFPENHKKAAKILKRGVELGSGEAMMNLGRMYAEGLGVKRDRERMYQLYGMAAEKHYAYGELMYSYWSGLGDDEAFRYVSRAAAAGLTIAEGRLGAFYIAGKGVETDYDEARRWFARAAAKGNEDAKRALADMDAGGSLFRTSLK